MKIKKCRKNILIAWILGNLALSLITSIIAMCYWQLTYQAELGVDWQPIDDLIGMLMIMPFGMLIFLVSPWSWINLSGLAFSLYKIDFNPLFLSFIGAIAFGIYWPEAFVAMMGI